ncbi:unnamed protein product [Agarophyton chilense]
MYDKILRAVDATSPASAAKKPLDVVASFSACVLRLDLLFAFRAFRLRYFDTMPALETDLLNPDRAVEANKHKLKRLVQSPNSYFMDVKCPGCYVITTVFSHAQTVVSAVSPPAAAPSTAPRFCAVSVRYATVNMPGMMNTSMARAARAIIIVLAAEVIVLVPWLYVALLQRIVSPPRF